MATISFNPWFSLRSSAMELPFLPQKVKAVYLFKLIWTFAKV